MLNFIIVVIHYHKTWRIILVEIICESRCENLSLLTFIFLLRLIIKDAQNTQFGKCLENRELSGNPADAATKPRNVGTGRSGRLRYSGWYWVPTKNGWSASKGD